jgi:hypothetical protein
MKSDIWSDQRYSKTKEDPPSGQVASHVKTEVRN